MESSLAELWLRTVPDMSTAGQEQFRDAILAMTGSWLWELANHREHRIPDPVDYVEMRRKTFGSDLTMSLCRLAHGRLLPPAIYRTRTMRAIDDSAADVACMTNDLFSYQKEIQFEGELHNCVLVVEHFFDCSKEQAVAVVNDLMGARLRQFEHLCAAELPS